VRGTDEGIWRRLRLVPFEVIIPRAEQDPQLPSKLAAEADGILRWLIDGYAEWRSRGLANPATRWPESSDSSQGSAGR
jgi:putative DNA primase/helicase